LSAAAAGIFVSMLANTEFQLMIIILLITVPQIFLSGLIPFVHIGDWFNGIGYGFPLRYAGEALTEVMIKGNAGCIYGMNCWPWCCSSSALLYWRF
jgi:ABC-2 type transporter.